MKRFLWNLLLALVWSVATGNFTIPNLLLGFGLGYFVLWYSDSASRPSPYFARVPRVVAFAAFYLRELVLADLRVAFTGTNPRPVLLEGTERLCGGPLEAGVLEGLDRLVRDQIMSMKTTFTPGHYRRRVAGVLARRLVVRLFAG